MLIYNRNKRVILFQVVQQIGPMCVLVCNWPHSDWTKSLVCKDAFHRDSAIQKCSRVSALFASQEKSVP
jgi:hypothetical protein